MILSTLAASTTCAALSLLPQLSFAQAVPNSAANPSYLDLYYVGVAELEVGDFEFDDGDGFGVKGRFRLGNPLFLSAEYQNSEYDPFDVDNDGLLGGSTTRYETELETFRAGLGVHLAETPFFVMGEYIGLESELSTTGSEGDEETIGDDYDESGFGAHAGIDGRFGQVLGLHAQIGYVDVGDSGDGLEYLAGLSFAFTPGIGVFADYRHTDLEEDVDTQLSDARVGLRISFH